jgi:tryptophan-rich sensory protein
LVISIFICQGAGFIGSLFTRDAIGKWYVFLNKPFFTPPNWIFAPVWTFLYMLMGISAYLVWRKGLFGSDVKKALIAFLFQLFLTSLWSIVFFGGRSILGGFVVIVLLWLAILCTMRAFFPFSKLAGELLIPYIAWVSFALILNWSILLIN